MQIKKVEAKTAAKKTKTRGTEGLVQIGGGALCGCVTRMYAG